jgi:prepilin-type N-terminal cleavage/methylation domain-containing protein
MKRRKCGQFRTDGYTLLEMLLALAISGAIIGIIASSYAQILKGKVGITQKSIAMTNIDSAIHWLTRDLVLAQTTNLGQSPASNMTLAWTDQTSWADPGNISHNVSYGLSGTNLMRTYDGQITTVARNMTAVAFSINGTIFNVSITSVPGMPLSSVTRTFKIAMRAPP